MAATNGRGDLHSAIMCWRWRPESLMARSLAHRLPPGFVPKWVALVPPVAERPEWIPESAQRYALADDDLAFVW